MADDKYNNLILGVDLDGVCADFYRQMREIDASLLTSFHEDQAFPGDLRNCLTARGLYSTMQFVLRLSPEVHGIIAETPTGIYHASDLSLEQVEAFSVYLHETIHWWQHIGSTAGLLLSLSYPVQSHGNYDHLKAFLREIGPKKSILKYAEMEGQPDSRATNIIINNYMDIEFFKVVATRPDLIQEVTESPYFECVGHSYEIMYANTLAVLAGMFDPEFVFLPDPRTWEPAFLELREERVEGFYHGSPIGIPPVGLRELFEGQARFCQLQYLSFGTGGRLTWEHASTLGLLGSVYVSAFKFFLHLTESQWPDKSTTLLWVSFWSFAILRLTPAKDFRGRLFFLRALFLTMIRVRASRQSAA